MKYQGIVFEKNIQTLEAKDPEIAVAILKDHGKDRLEVVTSKTGFFSLRDGNITLHSFYDPVKEAIEWVSHHREKVETASSLVVLGFGLGYHIIELCNLELCRVSKMDIFVFEPRLDILRKALELVDLRPVLSRVTFVTDDNVPHLKKGFEILEHKPSVTSGRSYFGKLLPKLKSLQRIKKGLKILVVGPIYGGSQPIAGYCAEALRNLGHQVDFMDNSQYSDALFSINKTTKDKSQQDKLRALLTNFVSEAIMARCSEYKPDLVFALAQAPLSQDFLMRFKENNTPTAFWFVEDFRLMDYWQQVAPFYDYFFTIQRDEFFDRLKEMGVQNFSYLPLAATPDLHKRIDMKDEEIQEYGSDLSFVGAGYYNRRNLFKGLVDFDFKIWGSDWDMSPPLGKCVQRSGARIETKEVLKIFNATKVNINLHSSTYYDGVNPHGDFVNPRTFEIAACESFQLVDFRSEMPELFKVGEELICFKDLDDLRKKIRYYLDNPEKRREIARRGRKTILREHTYECRMGAMLDFLAMRGYVPSQQGTEDEDEDVESLVGEAGKDTELGRYLLRFAGRARVSLSDIMEEIREGTGELSEVERMFLLIKELRGQFAPVEV